MGLTSGTNDCPTDFSGTTLTAYRQKYAYLFAESRYQRAQCVDEVNHKNYPQVFKDSEKCLRLVNGLTRINATGLRNKLDLGTMIINRIRNRI